MATLRENLLKVMQDVARQKPVDLGFRPYTFTIITRTWPAKVGEPGTEEDVPLVIEPTPKIRDITAQEVASSGGRFTTGMIRVGPITPYYAGPPAVGFTEAQLSPRSTSRDGGKVEYLYRVSGYREGDYELVEFTKARGGKSELGFELVLKKRNRP